MLVYGWLSKISTGHKPLSIQVYLSCINVTDAKTEVNKVAAIYQVIRKVDPSVRLVHLKLSPAMENYCVEHIVFIPWCLRMALLITDHYPQEYFGILRSLIKNLWVSKVCPPLCKWIQVQLLLDGDKLGIMLHQITVIPEPPQEAKLICNWR